MWTGFFRKGFSAIMAVALCMVIVSTATVMAGPANGWVPVGGHVVVAGDWPTAKPAPSSTPRPQVDVHVKSPKQAAIILTVSNPPPGAWTSVQWLNLEGTQWTDVGSWLGPLAQDDYGWMPLWIDDKDFGTGPFRWVVYDKDPRQGGKVWGMTQAFYFPTANVWMPFTLKKGDIMTAGTPGAAANAAVVFEP